LDAVFIICNTFTYNMCIIKAGLIFHI